MKRSAPLFTLDHIPESMEQPYSPICDEFPHIVILKSVCLNPHGALCSDYCCSDKAIYYQIVILIDKVCEAIDGPFNAKIRQLLFGFLARD